MAGSKQGASGGKHRKKGDWEAIAKGRQNRREGREVVSRGNRDMPDMGVVGSAAYRRMTK